MKNEDVEDIWIEAKIHNQKYIIGSVYRHPGTDISKFSEQMEIVMPKILMEQGRAFICGDFNIDDLKICKDKKTSEYFDNVLKQNFVPTICIPTLITESIATNIDNILMKLNNITINNEIERGKVYSDISDHLPNILRLKSSKEGPCFQKMKDHG